MEICYLSVRIETNIFNQYKYKNYKSTKKQTKKLHTKTCKSIIESNIFQNT